MGLLVDGVWHDKWYDTSKTKGKFERSIAQFRNWVTIDGSAGPSGEAGFKAEPGRYHLYVSYACPWAHRTLMMRQLKGLENIISLSVVHPLMLNHGWTFDTDFDGATGDHLFGHKYYYQIYTQADPHYSGRVTVPVLWDKQQNKLVSNESSEIIRMFNSAFNEVGAAEGDYYPEELRESIDSRNEWIYEALNNGVYKAGFATSQEAYDEAVTGVFERLDDLEKLLSQQRYLCGERFTEADIRLFPTLLRFDPVYVQHFKCDRRRIADYPALSGYLRDIYQMPGIRDTTNLEHNRHHYYRSHPTINPHGIISTGPIFDLDVPHGRGNI
ncbi:MAG: glutathione S-transferase family protein [Oceanospirillaceae bacterium]|nr:glutathione S-transferase family protein [Oceanospirillaceae bacterium]